MANTNLEEKLSATLFKFTTAGYYVSSVDETSVQKLLTWFSDNSVSEEANRLLELPVCTEWLKLALKLWEFMAPHFSIAAFSLKFTGILCKDVRRFETLQADHIVDSLCESLKPLVAQNVTVKVAYVDLLSKLLTHDPGCAWIMVTGVWKDVIGFCLHTPNIYLLRDSQKFAADLLVKLQSNESWSGCEEVLHQVLGPVVIKFKSHHHNGKHTSCGIKFADDDDKMKTIAAITLSCHVLEASLSGTCTFVSQILLKKYNLEALAWHTMCLAESESCMGRIAKFLVLIYFVALGKSETENEEVLVAEGQNFKKKIFQVLSFLLSKKSVTNILSVCSQCHIYFQTFNITASKFEKNSKLYEVEDQIIAIHILPILAGLRCTKATTSPFLESFMRKIFDITSEETVRLAYPYRDFLKEQESLYQKHTLQGITSLMRIKDHLHRDRGVIVFQAIMYSLKDFIPGFPHDSSVDCQYVLQHSHLLSVIIESLTALINKFNISWRESVESICLLYFAVQLLKNPCFPSTLFVSTLKLVQAAIQNYMPPNLALLMNSMDGSSTNEVCPLIAQHLKDCNWEVRDSALELLYVVCDMSDVKFTAFQEHVMKNNLCSLALALSLEDPESYVRASALKCVCGMVRVSQYWTDCLSTQDIPGKMTEILKNETEGIVRREAALIMKEIYHHHSFPKSTEEQLFKMMVSAAISDLHWEVRVNALRFWDKVISKLLCDQGMIDGIFPNVTFSKEKRKIVTLTENEIKLRLDKVMEELAKLECLRVLLVGIHDHDFEVVCEAAKVSTRLLQILSRHGLFQPDTEKPDVTISIKIAESSTSERKNGAKSPEKVKAVDPTVAIIPLDYKPVTKGKESHLQFSQNALKVIENLLDDSDMDLVKKMDCQSTIVDSEKTFKEKAEPVTAKDFLSAVSKVDLKNLTESKKRWLYESSDGLGSILDDILGFSFTADHSTTDCY